MDREKVIKQLENDAIATDTGYVEVPLWLFSEIIALLKEQEAVVRCGDCDYCERNDHTGWCCFFESKVFIDGFCSNGRRTSDEVLSETENKGTGGRDSERETGSEGSSEENRGE